MRRLWLLLIVLAAMLVSGCAIQTREQLYALPRRSQEYNNLQAVVDEAMAGLDYSAPVAGENQQTVQMADLDGDGTPEFLLFARGGGERPLHILIFRETEEGYSLGNTIECQGTAFDKIEYVQMDENPGMELVVGCQVSDQVVRAAGVYTFASGEPELLETVSYAEYLCTDLDGDGRGEIFLLRPGMGENGSAQILTMKDGEMEPPLHAEMSAPIENRRRIIAGQLSDGYQAVFVASTSGDGAMLTDVYTYASGTLANVTYSMESGGSLETLRAYPVFADDIDDDGVVELPDVLSGSQEQENGAGEQYTIRWYALDSKGNQTDKRYTYHDFTAGWYLDLKSGWAGRLMVGREDGGWAFYLRGEGESATRMLTVFAFTGEDREEQAVQDNRFVLLRTEAVTYAAHLEVASGLLDITQEELTGGFHLIYREWKTGET